MEYASGMGVAEFYREVELGNIHLGTLIRIYNEGALAPDEKFYVVGSAGLVDRFEGGSPQPFEDILSEENAPDGWDVHTHICDWNVLPKRDLEIISKAKGPRDPILLLDLKHQSKS